MDFPFSFLLAKSCNGPVESPIRCNVTSLGVYHSWKKEGDEKKFWLPMYHWRCNLNKLSRKQRQTKNEKIHKKMSEEHCSTLPTIGLGRPALGMGASNQPAEANAPPSNPRPSLPILPKGPISKILSLYQDDYQARALRALGLLLADGTPTVGGGKTF